MKKTISFYKLTAAGNDFVLIDNRKNVVAESEHSKLAAKLCDRRYSIGGDGLILLENSSKADFRMRYYNSDGSFASMCGNGGRSISKFAYELGVVDKKMTFETDAGLITAEIKSDNVVNLALYDPKNLKINEKIEVEDKTLTVSSLNTGVPHAVVFVDDIENIDVKKYGKIIRFHKHFAPDGTNVNFVKVDKNNTILVRTYERGVEDETLACGTGVTASAIISIILNKVESPVHIITRGKDNLYVSCKIDDGMQIEKKRIFKENEKAGIKVDYSKIKDSTLISDVFLEGPAIVAFKGTVDVDL